MLFLFLVVFNNYFVIPVAKKNAVVHQALAIPAGAPIIVAWETVQTPIVVAERTIKILSIYLTFYCITFID